MNASSINDHSILFHMCHLVNCSCALLKLGPLRVCHMNKPWKLKDKIEKKTGPPDIAAFIQSYILAALLSPRAITLVRPVNTFISD